MKIGDLASRSGVSIRTLHHYDEIGLLSPSHRTEAGHRVYGRDEVVRLQQILSLRQVGFALEEIRDLLDSKGMGPRQAIELHIARLKEQAATQRWLSRILTSMGSVKDAPVDKRSDQGAAKILDVIVSTSIQRRPVLEYQWTVQARPQP
jgi:DNA-binding transcriptional MerR regulator